MADRDHEAANRRAPSKGGVGHEAEETGDGEDGPSQLCLVAELVSHAIDGQDIPGFVGVGFKFAAQVADVRVDAAVVAAKRGIAVNSVQQLFAVKDLPRMLGQDRQQLELDAGELQ